MIEDDQGQPETAVAPEPDNARPYHVLDDPIVFPVILVGVVLTTALPVMLGQQICLPLLNGLVIFPFFAWALRLGRPRRAIVLALFWALCQSLATVAASLIVPEQAGLAIRQALEQRSELLAWIANGAGVPGSPALWLPRQLRDLGLFALATLVSGGLGGLVLLAAALNTAAFLAADLMRQAPVALLALPFAWPLWSLVRLFGYLATAAALAEPVAVLDLRPQWWRSWWARRRRLLASGLGIILLSYLLQLLLAPVWDDILRATTGL